MPGPAGLPQNILAALLEYLETGKNQKSVSPDVQAAVTAEQAGKREVESEQGPLRGKSPYRFTGYKKFLDPDGYPTIAPPWGTLNAIDLNTGRYLWKIPLVNYPELVAKGLPDTAMENYGGPIVTAGRVLFIGAMIDGKQYVVIAASG